jgi:PAS domain S-box-containing protein
MTNLDGTIRYINPAFTKLTGYTWTDAVGRTPRILRSGRHPRSFYKQLWSTILRGNVWKGEMVNRRKDGTLYDAALTIAPIRNREGRLTGFVDVQRDMTEQRQIETFLKAAKEQADSANRAKSEFIAKMSHELRTPLNSIIGFTEIMLDNRKDPPSAKQARRLEKVHRNANNLLLLINDILDFAKMEADRMTFDAAVVDVADVVTDCVESARPLARRTVRLHLDLDPSLRAGPAWVGDPLRLRQVITNLLSNAAKFTEAGHIRVRAVQTADQIRIEVEDTGIGIPPEHLPTIFDEFQQVDSSSTRRASGAGLGLAISRQLCRRMGGDLDVRSTLREGSCFSLTLPRCPPDPPEDPATATRHARLYITTSDAAASLAAVTRASDDPSDRHAAIHCVTTPKRAVRTGLQVRPHSIWIDPSRGDALFLLADLATRNALAGVPIGLLGIHGRQVGMVTFDGYIVWPAGKNSLRAVLTGPTEKTSCRALALRLEQAADSGILPMLTEFSGVTITEVGTAEQAIRRLQTDRWDALLVNLLDPQGAALQMANHIARTRGATTPRLLALTPREPAQADVRTLRAQFELHTQQHGVPIRSAVERLCDEDLDDRKNSAEEPAAVIH